MAGRLRTTGVMLMGLCAALALGLTYTWEGLGPDHHWDTCGNWSPSGVTPCYPDDPGDRGVVPLAPATTPWSVDLIDIDRIDELTVSGHVDFGSAGGQAVLKLHKIVFQAGVNPVASTMGGGASIQTVKSQP